MSGFADLCECLCRQFSHQMETVNAILQAVNGQEVVTSQGFGDSTTAFGLPPRPTSGVSGSALAMMTMIVLFVMLLLSLRRQIQDTNQERDVTLTKATSSSASSSSGHPRRDDPNRDRDFLQ